MMSTASAWTARARTPTSASAPSSPPAEGVVATAIERFDVILDLTHRTWRVSARSARRPTSPDTLAAEFLAQADIHATLAERRRVLRALYRHNHAKVGPVPATAAADPFVPPARATARIGRNDPCPCGSGRKYKKCCMDKTP